MADFVGLLRHYLPAGRQVLLEMTRSRTFDDFIVNGLLTVLTADFSTFSDFLSRIKFLYNFKKLGGFPQKFYIFSPKA